MSTLPLRPHRLDRRSFLAMTGVGAMGLVTACASAVSQQAAPKRGGTLTIATGVDALPTTAFGSYPGNFYMLYAFDTLTRMNTTNLTPNPVLATSWSFSDSNTTMTLKLRGGVKYHSGRPLSPQDVIASVEQQQNPARNSQVLQIATLITDMAPSGSDQVKLRLAYPVPNIYDLFELMPIIDPETVDGLLKGTQVNGTGPFIWSDWAKGTSLTLTKNKAYWQPGRPLLDKLVFQVIADPQAQISALQSHQVQMITITPQNATELKGDKHYTISQSPQLTVAAISCNVDIPPLNNKQFRQAISWAMDRKSLNQKVYAGTGEPTSIPWPPSSPAFTKSAAGAYHLDPSRARQLVTESGVTPKFSLYYRNDSTELSEIAQVAQANLQEVGITAQLVGLPNAQYTPMVQQGKVPGAWVQNLGFNFMHPATFIISANPLRAQKPTTNVNDPSYSQLVQSAVQATNPEASKSDFAKITNYYLDEQYVIILVSRPSGTFARASSVQGIRPQFFSGYGDLTDAHL